MRRLLCGTRLHKALCLALVALASAAMMSPAGATTISYGQSDTEELLGSAGYLDMSGQEFVNAAVEVHWFLLKISDKTAPGGACDIEFGAPPTGFWEFDIPAGEAIAGISARYCIEADVATTASAALLHFLTRIQADAVGIDIAEVRAPCVAVGEEVTPRVDEPLQQSYSVTCRDDEIIRRALLACGEIGHAGVAVRDHAVTAGELTGIATKVGSWLCVSIVPRIIEWQSAE